MDVFRILLNPLRTLSSLQRHIHILPSDEVDSEERASRIDRHSSEEESAEYRCDSESLLEASDHSRCLRERLGQKRRNDSPGSDERTSILHPQRKQNHIKYR